MTRQNSPLAALAVLTVVGVPLYAWMVRGRTYAIFSLVILAFSMPGMLIVHARFAGWLHNFGLAVVSIVGFLSVLMTYYGVNFILASGLHSYGFSAGGTMWLVAYVVFECVVIGWATARHRAAIAEPVTESDSENNPNHDS